MSFEAFLLILLLVSGAVWAFEVAWLRKRRAAGRVQPWWVEYSISFFPVIFVVFVLRAFVVEPFKIPSGSMIPTLLVGDYILVNKFDFGIRLPIIHTEVIHIGEPKRGDVMVFRYPDNPSEDYIKRVIGLPGDRVAYINKRLTINGHLIPEHRISNYLNHSTMQYSERFVENLFGVKHQILIEKDAPPYVPKPTPPFPFEKDCQYNMHGVICTVPPHHYFVMGDNRDNSSDSRYWGFVPEKNIVGRAFWVWLNLDHFGRFGPIH